jgi:hypothetical protein
MNTRSKLLTTLAAALAVTAGAGATATFAWFRTTRTSQVNVANANIWGDGDLQIAYSKTGEYEGVSYAGLDTENNGFGLTGVTNNATDVSGDGLSMYKPNWDKTVAVTEETALGINKVVNGLVDSKATYYYMHFGITVTNKGTTDFDLYLNDKCAATPVSSSKDADVHAANSMRVSFNQGTTILSTWQPNLEGTKTANTDYSYVTTANTGTKLYGVDKFTTAHPAAATFHAGSFSKLSDAADAKANAVAGQKLITVPAGEANAVTIECTIWLEGTLAAATKTCIGGNVKIILGFVGL